MSPVVQSFIPVAKDSHFPIQNIPFGVFSTAQRTVSIIELFVKAHSTQGKSTPLLLFIAVNKTYIAIIYRHLASVLPLVNKFLILLLLLKLVI